MSGKYWTDSFGIVHGCSPVSPACKHCWAASEAHMRAHQKNPKMRAKYAGLTYLKDGIPTFNGMVRLDYDALKKPLKARKPRIYAVGWGGDLFHKNVPYDFLVQVFEVIRQTPRHKYLILTKRPERMVADIQAISSGYEASLALFNCWFGTTVENQSTADERIPHLLKVPGKRWLSVEPMLGGIDIRPYIMSFANCPIGGHYYQPTYPFIHQVVAGGENGHGARPSYPDYFRSLRDQRKVAGVPFYFKSFGTYKGPGDWNIPAGRLLDGVEHNELAWTNDK